MNLLYVDDDDSILVEFEEFWKTISHNEMKLETESDFNNAKVKLSQGYFDIVVLDVFRGQVSLDNNDKAGIDVLNEIKKICFVPVIFFTGLVSQVEDLASEVVKIVRKGDGFGELEKTIELLQKNGFASIRSEIVKYVENTIRDFFWKFVADNWSTLKETLDINTLKLILVRKLSLSLSKDNLPSIVDINASRINPLEFYVFPPVVKDRFETGDIFKKGEKIFVMLTSTCDLFPRNEGRVPAEMALLAEGSPLKERVEYEKYINNKGKNELNELKKLMDNRKPNLFFIPAAGFIDNQVFDFQLITAVAYPDLKTYEKIAKLDSPFAESMLSKFIGRYNKVGIPDIDSDRLLNEL